MTKDERDMMDTFFGYVFKLHDEVYNLHEALRQADDLPSFYKAVFDATSNADEILTNLNSEYIGWIAKREERKQDKRKASTKKAVGNAYD